MFQLLKCQQATISLPEMYARKQHFPHNYESINKIKENKRLEIIPDRIGSRGDSTQAYLNL